ncbi:MAG: kynureninase [Gemmatimonadales bacterium]
MPSLDSLRASPNALAPHYSRFRVADRLLLTGHSHQAWPDVGFEAQQRAWLDAAELVDDKWSRAFEVASQVREGWRRLLGDPDGDYALGQNTFDLVIRFLSALPLRARPRLVTTDGEFHSVRRLADRLDEAGLEIVRVHRDPVDSLAERLADATDDRTAAVLVSAVLFLDARIVPNLREIMARCATTGAELLVDAYHALGVTEFTLSAEGLEGAWVTGAGYKYVQLGEGNGFLRMPPGTTLRPVATGWFSEFSALSDWHDGSRVQYGTGGDRFAGATYDPTSSYRAAAVFEFAKGQGLSPGFLREVSQHQVRRLAERFDALGADPDVVTRDRTVPLEQIGGFLALRSSQAAAIQAGLHARGVMTDYRAEVVRLGPAPYLSDSQLDAAIEALGEVAR